VYIIYSASSDIYYKGVSENYLGRLEQHNNNLSRYTAGKGPWKMVYVEEFVSKTDALVREKMLKRQNRKYLEWLILQPVNKLQQA